MCLPPISANVTSPGCVRRLGQTKSCLLVLQKSGSPEIPGHHNNCQDPSKLNIFFFMPYLRVSSSLPFPVLAGRKYSPVQPVLRTLQEAYLDKAQCTTAVRNYLSSGKTQKDELNEDTFNTPSIVLCCNFSYKDTEPPVMEHTYLLEASRSTN